MNITSDTMTIVPGSHLALAHGHVHAVGSTFEADCDDGDVTYGDAGGSKHKIDLMVLHNHVRLHRFSDGLVANSELATYTAATREVVLTQNPVAVRGPHTLHGEKMTVALDSEVTHVLEPRAEIMRANNPYPVHISAESMVSTDGGKHVHFDRNVQLHDPTFRARSDRMDVDLENPGGSNDTNQISRMTLSGHVVGHRTDEDGTAGKAVYEGASGDWVLTEQPVVNQEGNTVEGERIVVDGATGRARAEKGHAIIPETEK
jgi:lipopolysaccharide transport protein LptA